MIRGMDYVKNNIAYSILNKCQLTSKTNLSTIVLFTTTLMLLTSPFVLNEAFATHLSDELKWQLVYISSQPACSNYHYQMTEIYHDISLKYMDLYQLESSAYDPECIPEKKYFSDYVSPDDLDLIILIYDKNLGEKELHGNKMGGLYTHSGLDRTQNHAVIICDCANFYYSNPAWILTHELSHFVLYYKDYEMTVIEDSIHVTDAKYDQCLENYTEDCKSISTKLEAGPGGYGYSVMPVYQPAIGIESVKGNQQKSNMSPVVSELSKVITKWWASGKITDGDYANAIGYVVDNNVLSSHEDFTIVMADDPIDETPTWEQVMEEITPSYWDHASSVVKEDKIENMLSRIPANLLSDDISIYSDDNSLGLPDWFKETAQWWANDEITNKDFNKNVEYLLKSGIIQPHTSEIIGELIAQTETIGNSKIVSEPEQSQIVAESDVTEETVQETTNAQAQITQKPKVQSIVYSEDVQELVNQVKALILGKDLQSGDGNELANYLNLAAGKFEMDKTDNGCKHLDKFKSQVNYFIETDRIHPNNGQILLKTVENIIGDSC